MWGVDPFRLPSSLALSPPADAMAVSDLLTFTCRTNDDLTAFKKPSTSSAVLTQFLRTHHCPEGKPETMSTAVRDTVDAVTGWLRPAAVAAASPAPPGAAGGVGPGAPPQPPAAADGGAALMCSSCATDLTDWLYFHCAACDVVKLCGCCGVESCPSCSAPLRPVFMGGQTPGILHALRVCGTKTLTSVASCLGRRSELCISPGSELAWTELWYSTLNMSLLEDSVVVAG